jgi:hypothetical protein
VPEQRQPGQLAAQAPPGRGISRRAGDVWRTPLRFRRIALSKRQVTGDDRALLIPHPLASPHQETAAMFMQIIVHTPIWVWVLLVVLIAVGSSQLAQRRIAPLRATLVPLLLSALSLAGVVTGLARPELALPAWIACTAVVAAAMLSRAAPAGTAWDAVEGRFVVPGSAVPLVAMMGLFLTKYAVGVSLALNHLLVRDAVFTVGAAAIYGGFSGLFLGRAARLWRLRGAAGSGLRSAAA